MQEEPYTPLGNVAFPVTEEAGSAEEQQLRSFQDLLLRTFEPQPDLAMPISTPYPPPVCLPSEPSFVSTRQSAVHAKRGIKRSDLQTLGSPSKS